LASFSTTSTGPDGHDNIVDFRYLNNSASICCVLSGGDLVLVKVETEIHEERVDVIGNVEGGILAAEWTLDEEILAVASGIQNIPHSPNLRTIKNALHDFGFRNNCRGSSLAQ
jgi:elongator complex protein 1